MSGMTRKPGGPAAQAPADDASPAEARQIAEMADILQRKMARDYAAGITRRDAHPKSLGVLRASFTIEPGLPEGLRVGLFAQQRRCDCWLRLSSASGKPQSDAVPDLRGLAIKLLGDDGQPLGQDFVLLSHPTMPLGTVALFRDAVYYTIERSPLLLAAKLALTGQLGVLWRLNAARTRPNSPLDIRYWSTTPYRFGSDAAVKYSLIPRSAHQSPAPGQCGDDYLSAAMAAHLAGHEAVFDFCVQRQLPGMPIEDAAVRWAENLSPFQKVATLRIAPQAFRTPEREALGETLSFSPGHALPDHTPLGGINRARIAIYGQLSAFRHARDGRADLA